MILRRTVFFLVLLIVSPNIWCQDLGIVRKGKLDLRGWNSEQQPVILLDGEWEFYWEKLVLFKDLQGINDTSFARLSIPWNEQLIAGHEYPKDGFATYALEILLPSNTMGVAFAVPAVFNSYAFWVNDKLICNSGKVGASRDKMIPQWKPQTLSVGTPQDTLHVIFQISNFQHTRGGCSEIMRIGNAQYLTNLDSAFHASGLALIIIFGIAAASGLALAFINRRNSFLYLALLALAYMIRFLFSDLYFYYDIGIKLSWETAAKIEYLTLPLVIVCAALFISVLYPQEFKRAILKFFIVINIVLTIIVISASSSLFSPLLIVLQIEGLVFAIFSIYIIVRALIFKRSGAWISGLSAAVFVSVGFYNIYAFVIGADLNRIVIHSGYALALLLNIISLVYRTPLRLESEEQDILRYADLYNNDEASIKDLSK